MEAKPSLPCERNVPEEETCRLVAEVAVHSHTALMRKPAAKQPGAFRALADSMLHRQVRNEPTRVTLRPCAKTPFGIDSIDKEIAPKRTYSLKRFYAQERTRCDHVSDWHRRADWPPVRNIKIPRALEVICATPRCYDGRTYDCRAPRSF